MEGDSLQQPWGTVRPSRGARTQMSGPQILLRDVGAPRRLYLGQDNHTRLCGPSGNPWSCQTSIEYLR